MVARPTSNGGARIPGPHLLFMSDSYRWSLAALSDSTSVHISHKVHTRLRAGTEGLSK